jgi:hypothetical protein
MLKGCNLSKDFWAEALNSAVYIVNRIPSRGKVSPYEALFGRCPKLSNLRIFGCKAFVQFPRDTIKKLDDRAWEGVLVGYDDHNWRCYRIWDPVSATVKLGVHVTFDESKFPSPLYVESEEPDAEIETLTPNILPRRAEDLGNTAPEAYDGGEPPGGAEPPGIPAVGPMGNIQATRGRTHPMMLRRRTRVSEPVGEDRGRRIQMLPKGTRLPDHIALAVGDLMGYPKTYREAMSSPDRDKWMGAMKKELSALEKNDTWDLVPKPKNFPVIDVRWVFTMKCNNQGEPDTAKARNVVKGYRQIEGINVFDTEAPVTRPVSIRTVFALTTMYDWHCQNMDVDTAFLNAPVEEEIYIRQPEGFEQRGPKGEELVCRLKKSLYGLKQASRNWNIVINSWLKDYGLEPSPADSCLYIKRSGKRVIVVLLWVDDLIICGNDKEEIARFKTAISKRFHMKDLGDLKRILGMEVTRDRKARVMTVKQQGYMKVLLERFGMTDCRPIGAPAEGCLLRDPNAGPDRDYMTVVGSLLYLAMITRPDVAYAVQSMGRHLQGSNESHFAAGKRILRYIQGTKDLGLTYTATAKGSILEGFADSDWASDKDTRRSVTAYVFMLGGAAVSWASRLQPAVALSSAESEYMAASAAAQEAIHLRALLASLGFPQEDPTVIWDDSQGCIAMSKNPIQHKRTKHIDIRYHFVREAVERKDIKLCYIPTQEQLADLLTKAVPKGTVQKLRPLLLGG